MGRSSTPFAMSAGDRWRRSRRTRVAARAALATLRQLSGPALPPRCHALHGPGTTCTYRHFSPCVLLFASLTVPPCLCTAMPDALHKCVPLPPPPPAQRLASVRHGLDEDVDMDMVFK